MTLADTKALIAFVETSDDSASVEDVLSTLLVFMDHKPLLIAFVEHICALGGCQIVLGLLRR